MWPSISHIHQRHIKRSSTVLVLLLTLLLQFVNRELQLKAHCLIHCLSIHITVPSLLQNYFQTCKNSYFFCLNSCGNATLKAVRTLRPTSIHHLPRPPYLHTADTAVTPDSGALSNKNPCLNNATAEPL